MGSIIGKTMGETMEKQQEAMATMQAKTMERQMHMQNYMREQMMATQLARSRDVFNYFSAFYGTVITFGLLGAVKTKKPMPLIPAIFIGFPFAYQYDLVHGNKMDRIKAEAERILKEERAILNTPEIFPPSLDKLDELRSKAGSK